jgi:DNA-binding CsgD family transcriptional regulator
MSCSTDDMRAALALVERTGAAQDLDAFRAVLASGIRTVIPGVVIAYDEVDNAEQIVLRFSPDQALTLLRAGLPFTAAERDIATLLEPHLVNGYRAARQASPGLAARRLTAREREVLQHVADGLSDRQIAQHLGIAAGTVRKHLERVRCKLGVPTRAAAVAAVAV